MKRERNPDGLQEAEAKSDTAKPTAVFEAAGGRAYTTTLAGQIARALAVFCVDEVVVFDDGGSKMQQRSGSNNGKPHYYQNGGNGFTGYADPNYFLMHILSYLETPPFLRRHLFPMHPDLKQAGSLPSLDMPHHLRSTEWCRYREGITVEETAEDEGSKRRKKHKKGEARPVEMSLVDVGLARITVVPATIPPNTRVTIKLPKDVSIDATEDGGPIAAKAVAPSAPREEEGYYWGYSVRAATCLSAVITECDYPGGYDLTLGTSERGAPITELTRSMSEGNEVPTFNHMLIVFGGVAGLEVAVGADDELQKMGVKEPKQLFDYWVNLCPGQGSRTIRTEEAIWLGLMGLREVVVSKGRR
ncbi:MAG: hypothetical protein Q9200_004961 [Gallowayella weberi]